MWRNFRSAGESCRPLWRWVGLWFVQWGAGTIMWCANCQADVAAEVAADNRRVRCAHCGSEIDALRSLRTTDKTREARQLLQRWSSGRTPVVVAEDLRSGVASGPDSPAPAAEDLQQPKNRASLADTARAAARRDPPHSAPHLPPHVATPAPQRLQGAQPSGTMRLQGDRPDVRRQPEFVHREDAAHLSLPSPHLGRGYRSPYAAESKPTNWLSAFGQFLAYGGVLGLTVGTTLVLWGHFGSAQQAAYAPTGWLVATAGQMLLFLGVVTLVSTGIEQATEEMRRSTESLSGRLQRVEDLLHRQPEAWAESQTAIAEEEPAPFAPAGRRAA